MTKTVKVAEYRNETDHLFRLVNVDYHACVSAREVERWKETTSRVLNHVQGLQCARASDYDREQLAKAVTAANAQLVAADARIVQLQSKPANTVQRADNALTENALLALLGLADNVGAQLLNIGPSITASQIERVRSDWVEMAGGEPVVVEYVKGAFYGFCSELAAYRIERKYNCRPKCQAGYSQNMGTWYVRLETNLNAEGVPL